jgi:hypothetical protein
MRLREGPWRPEPVLDNGFGPPRRGLVSVRPIPGRELCRRTAPDRNARPHVPSARSIRLARWSAGCRCGLTDAFSAPSSSPRHTPTHGRLTTCGNRPSPRTRAWTTTSPRPTTTSAGACRATSGSGGGPTGSGRRARRHTGTDPVRPPLAGHADGGVLLDGQRGRLERPPGHPRHCPRSPGSRLRTAVRWTSAAPPSP